MLPIRDDTPRYTTPFVTYFLIALNILIYLFESALAPPDLKMLSYQFGLVPAQVTAMLAAPVHFHPAAIVIPFFTSMFLHGSWMHVIGNMWFLWIFGDNIEDYLGHFGYLVFYLVCGVMAGAAQVVLDPNLTLPTVGASGAIAGVLGGYFLLYPRARVLMWFVFVFYLPAWVVLGYWFVVQFVNAATTSIVQAGHPAGGVAFWAHVGGFLAGIILIKLFPQRAQTRRYGAW
jgi:membrane associated rhomboid family serine protease